MRVAILHYGEPAPSDASYRRYRYGHLSAELVARGHQVFRVLPNFSHLDRHRRAKETEVWHATPDEGSFLFIDTPSYDRSIGLRRLTFLRTFSRGISRSLPLRLVKPDVILAGYPAPSVLTAAATVATETNARLVADVRDVWPEAQLSTGATTLRPITEILGAEIRRRNSAAFERLDGAVAISSTYLNWIESSPLLPPRLPKAVFPLGARAQLTPKAVGPGSSGGLKACFFGSLSSHFDLRYMVKGWLGYVHQLSNADYSASTLTIGGKGNGERLLLKLIKNEPSIAYLGWVDPPSVERIQSQSDVGLAPYRLGATMTLPNKILDYINSGLVPISTLGGETLSVLSETGSGLTADPSEPNELTRLLTMIDQSTQLRRDIVHAGQTLIRDHYAIDRIYPDFADFLQHIGDL